MSNENFNNIYKKSPHYYINNLDKGFWLASSNAAYRDIMGNLHQSGEWTFSQGVPSNGNFKVHISVRKEDMPKAMKIFLQLAYKQDAPEIGWKVALGKVLAQGQPGKQIVVENNLGKHQNLNNFLLNLYNEFKKNGIRPDPRPFNSNEKYKGRYDKVLSKYFGYRVAHHDEIMKWQYYQNIQHLGSKHKKYDSYSNVKLIICKDLNKNKLVCVNFEENIKTFEDLQNSKKTKYQICGEIGVSFDRKANQFKIDKIHTCSDYLKGVPDKYRHILFPGLNFREICDKLENSYEAKGASLYIRNTFDKENYLDRLAVEIQKADKLKSASPQIRVPHVFSKPKREVISTPPIQTSDFLRNSFASLQQACNSYKKICSVFKMFRSRNEEFAKMIAAIDIFRRDLLSAKNSWTVNKSTLLNYKLNALLKIYDSIGVKVDEKHLKDNPALASLSGVSRYLKENRKRVTSIFTKSSDIKRDIKQTKINNLKLEANRFRRNVPFKHSYENI